MHANMFEDNCIQHLKLAGSGVPCCFVLITNNLFDKTNLDVQY